MGIQSTELLVVPRCQRGKEGSMFQIQLKIYLAWQNEVVKDHISSYLDQTLFTV
jgi:hypothetical protein